MMNYQEMSDHEISCEVGRRLSLVDYLMVVNCQRDYCNSWADAGPIAQENKISVLFDEQGMSHATHEACWVDGVEWQIDGVVDENPCRAICIVFLMMKGGE